MKFLNYFIVAILLITCSNNSILPMQKAQLLDIFERMEKSELHLHLGGAWPISFLEEIASPEEFSELKKLLHKIQQGVDYHAAFQVFNVVAKIVNTDQKVEDGVAALCKELSADHVTYVEIRTGLKNLGSGSEGYLQAVLRGIIRGCEGTNLRAVVLLSLRRDSSRSAANEAIQFLEKYRTQGVVGLDISGDSTQGDGNDFLDLLANASSSGIPITLHLGESPKESAEQQIKELEIIQPKRIGHAVHLCKQAISWVRKNHVPIEFCPSSALMVGMVQKLDQHPAVQLLREGHPVIICTDDPLIFDISLSQEYEKIAQECDLEQSDLEQCCYKSSLYFFESI